MNNKKRKEIKDIIQQLSKIREALNGSDNIIDDITRLAEEEREIYDNLPENLQYSQRADDTDEAATSLEEAQSSIENLDFDDFINSIDETIEHLEEIN